MNRHASMNRIYRLIWNQVRSAWVPVAETARGRGKSGRAKSVSTYGVVAGVSLAFAPLAHASGAPPPCVAPACGVGAVSASSHPTGGHVVSGAGSISQTGDTTTIQQSSQNLFLDWLSFNVGSEETVNFVQPSANAIAVNEISSVNGSQILGHLNANGEVWLINPNGIVFGQGAQVNVGGLVASTLNEVTLSGNTATFSGTGAGSITNEGTINAATGGSVALLGSHVSNEGAITARVGTVALGAGSAVTLTFSGNSLVKMQVDESTLNTLAENGGVIQADGGTVILSAGAKNALLASVVNNTGVIEARTVENHDGTIELLGGMTAGTVKVGGTLDASAPEGGNGGFIETNAAHVEVANDARITTAAAGGLTGTWLIDPQDFTVAPSGGDITGATLSSELGGTSVTLESSQGANAGSGNVNVNDTVSWSANTSLTLTASNNVNVNGSITAAGVSAALVINPNTANGTETSTGTGTLNLGAGASITLSGATAALSISTPTYSLGAGATINLPNVSPTSTTALVIGGTPYTVINSLGAQGSSSGTDLQGISENLSGDYALGSNVDATATSGWSGGAGFAPLGNASTPFSGIFDGLGHTIGNLTIKLPTTPNVGLFGYTAPGAVIQNVGLTGGTVTGGNATGMLVGFSQGTVNNTYSAGTVNGANGANGAAGANGSYSCAGGGECSGTANGGNGASGGAGGALGGLVGINSGAINSSSSSATVSGGNGGTGGNGGNGVSFFTIPALRAGATYGNGGNGGGGGAGGNVGGLVGSNSGSINQSFAAGSVTGATGGNGGKGGSYGGGLCLTIPCSTGYAGNGANGNAGGSIGGLAGSSTGTINSSFASGAVSGGSGGSGGEADATEQSPSPNNGDSGAGGASAGLVGYNAGSIASSYATGTVSGANGGSSTTGISSYDGGAGGAVGGLVGYNESASISNSYATGAVTGANGGKAGSDGVDGYAGGAGGAGGQAGGLIGMDVSGTVLHSYATGAVTGGNGGGGAVGGGWYYNNGIGGVDLGGNGEGGRGGQGGAAGGLIGSENSGVIVGSFAAGSVSGANGGMGGADDAIQREISPGIIGSGGNGGNAGALAGFSSSTISTSYATGAVKGGVGGNGGQGNNIADPGAGGNGGSVGGFVGTLAGSISTSYSTGSVSGATAGQASQGAAYAGQNGAAGSLGGFAGGGAGSATGSYWDLTTSGVGTSAGGTGLTTTQMQTQASFAGWDFSATWVVYGGYTFPLLQSYLTPLTVTANDATTTYNGLVVNNSVTYSTAPNGNLLGTLVYGPAQGAINAGNYVIAPGGLYSNQQGYLISYVNGALTINPLALTGAAISAGSSTYGSSVTPGTLSFSNVVAGDDVTATVSLVNPLYSSSLHLAAGSYAQSASATLTGTSAGNYTFAGYTTPTSNYTVTPLTLTGATIAPVTTTYGSAVTSGALSFSNVVAGDVVSATVNLVNPTYSGSNNVNAGSYAQTASVLTGADAGDYAFAGFTTATNNYTVNPLTLAVTGLSAANKVYNGSSAAALTGSASIGSISGDAVTLSGTGSASFADANVGNGKAVTVSGYSLTGNDAVDYVLVEPTGLTANITQLGSVAWVGGATGNWSNAANWAGGAIPDFSNVAAVIIPAGKTVTYDAGVLGTTVLTTLTDSGKLVMAAGNLTTTGNFSTAGYQQTGGTLDVGGTLSINSTAGAVTLGNIDANSASIISRAGAISQVAATALDVTGATSLTADDGVTGAGDVKYNITLTQAGNSFGGAVTSNGLNINLLDTTGALILGNTTATGNVTVTSRGAGGLALGNTTVTGALTATSQAGAITQAASTTVDVNGPVSLTADNGVSGSGAVKYNISLGSPTDSDSFGSAVTSTGLNINLQDSGAGGLLLGNTTATGTLTATSSDGAITQAAYTALNVTGASSLTADNGASGAADVKYDITLANANHFAGAVSSDGLNIDLVDRTGGLKLGNTTATGTLSATALGGAITQVAATALDVSGTSSLTADNGAGVKYGITLTQTADLFGGAVTADGSAITLRDATALTVNLDSSGATSLIAAGALNVSGTVGTTLTTRTTGAHHATTFGASTVGTTLTVTSTGAVTETASNILMVDGEDTTTFANTSVTVNGVTGAEITAP